MKKLIKVTQKHIDKGEPTKARFCPITLAVADATGGLHVATGNIITSWHDPVRGHRSGELPRSAKRFISKFDSKNKVKPFNFYLDIPD